MTIEQAIEVIRKLFNAQGIDALTREELDALTMAIRSFKAWQKVKTEIADIYCGQYCENPYAPDKVRELALEIIDNALAKIEQD